MRTAFANSWKTDSIPDFRNEVKEVNEVKEGDEDKDGWVWVREVILSDCILTSPKTSNRLLHKLARRVRGFEKRREIRLDLEQYLALFARWELSSKMFFTPRKDYLSEFLAKLGSVKVPEGATLAEAFRRTEDQAPPAKLRKYPVSDVQRFGSLCRELSAMSNGEPIMLSQSAISKLFGREPRTICNWIGALKTLGMLNLAVPPVPKKSAAAYFYFE